jgi:arginase
VSAGRQLAVVGAPTSAGAYAPGQERAPRALRDAGLLGALRDAGWAVDDRGDVDEVRWAPDPHDPRAANVAAAAGVATDVAAGVRDALDGGGADRVLVLGGDCTVGVGTVAGLADRGRVGLVYLDLHADLNVPAATGDGALDWMGVAHLLGLEGTRPALRDVGPRTPLLAAEDVVIVGFDADHATPFELATIHERGVPAIPLAELAADPQGAGRRALAGLASCDVLAVHLDVDLVDFLTLPLSENVERDGGVTLDVALAVLGLVAAHPRCAAITVTEVNPDHGAADGSTLATFAGALARALAA